MLRLLIFPIIFFTATALNAQATISGHLSNTDAWADTIYLRAIINYEHLFAATNMYLAASSAIDVEGNFSFNLESLQCTECLYRLDLPLEGKSPASLFFDTSKENFALFDLRPGQHLIVSADADQLLKSFQIIKGNPAWTFSAIRKIRVPFYNIADAVHQQFSNPANLVGKNVDSLRLAAIKNLEKRSIETNIPLQEMMESSDNVYDKIVGLLKYDYDRLIANDVVVYQKTLTQLELLAPKHPYTLQLRAAMEKDLKELQVGDEAPDILLPDPDGNAQRLFATSDGLILLDFWASWCSPCRLENRTTVVPLHNKFFGKGFSVFSVSLDSKKDPWVAAIKKDGMNWTNVLDFQGDDSSVAFQFGVVGIPATLLIDAATKTILARNLRGDELQRFVENYLARK